MIITFTEVYMVYGHSLSPNKLDHVYHNKHDNLVLLGVYPTIEQASDRIKMVDNEFTFDAFSIEAFTVSSRGADLFHSII